MRKNLFSFEYSDMANEASSSASAFQPIGEKIGGYNSLSPRMAVVGVSGGKDMGRTRYMSGPSKYAGATKRNLKQWLTDDNYVKNIVLKEMNTTKGGQQSIFNAPPRFSVKATSKPKSYKT